MPDVSRMWNRGSCGGTILAVLFVIGLIGYGFNACTAKINGQNGRNAAISNKSQSTTQTTTKSDSAANNNSYSAAQTNISQATATPALPRTVTYSPNYTYKRMSNIHSSVEATDAEMRQMSDLIHSFNNSWIVYINTGDRSVFNYLREGTEAYKNAVKYGSKNISESYETMDIRDARKAGNDFYVWDYEVINEYSNTTKRKEYHWVYRISKDSGGYYIADYTSDPAYN